MAASVTSDLDHIGPAIINKLPDEIIEQYDLLSNSKTPINVRALLIGCHFFAHNTQRTEDK